MTIETSTMSTLRDHEVSLAISTLRREVTDGT
jgi:hypothetical protein